MATDLREAIRFMEQYGIYDVIIPFILVFTIIFATLQKIQIFGKQSRKYNLIIALAIALMFVAATNLVEALNQYLPIIGVILAAFLGLMLMLGMFRGEGEEGLGKTLIGIIVIGAILAVGLFYFPTALSWIIDQLKKYPTIIVIIIIAGIILWLSKGEKKTKPPQQNQ